MTSVSLCSTSDVMTFDQNRHRLYSSSAGGRDLSNDTHAICMKILRDLSKNLAAKFFMTTLSYCIVKIACLNVASEIFELEGQSLQQI